MLAALLAFGGMAAPATARVVPAGKRCHRDWPAVVYHAGRTVTRSSAGSRHPVVCASSTGYASSESTIAVTKHGAVFYSPANSENSLVRSRDQGGSWRLVQPRRMQYTSLWNTVDPQVVVDRRTGRLFWAHTTHSDDVHPPVSTDGSPLGWLAPTAIANAHGFQVFSSANGGRRWTTADYQHEFTADWEKIFVGPPRPARTGAAQPVGYPDVVYLCANAPLEVGGPGRACYRSLDGGATFDFTGYVYPSATSPPAACQALAANTGVVAPDGTTYQPQSCSNGTYLAVSRNEGKSYSWLPVSGAPASNGLGAVAQLAIDHAGNLYVLWEARDQLYLAISRDRGRSWTRPLAIAAPGLHELSLPALAAGPRGDVGVVYYASTSASSRRLSAYASETHDALDRRPRFYGAAINRPAHPIFRDYGYGVTPRADFIGATYAGGTLWAGVVKQLGPPDADSRVPTTGYVASLRFTSKARR